MIFVTKWQRTLGGLHSNVWLKIKVKSDKLLYLTEISKQSTEGEASFLLIVFSKIREEREKLK